MTIEDTMRNEKGNKVNSVAGALAGVTMLVGGAEVAVAGLMTQTQSANVPSGDYTAGGTHEGGNNVLQFNLFDPSLGNLQEVSINMEGGTISIVPDENSNNDGDASLQGTFVVNFSNDTGSPFNDPWYQSTLDSTAECINGVCSFSGEVSEFISPAMTYDVNLNDFIGVGSFDVIFGFNNTNLSDPSLTGVYGGEPFRLDSSDAFLVQYTYEEIPIPGTLALTALGLGAIAATRKRRRKLER